MIYYIQKSLQKKYRYDILIIPIGKKHAVLQAERRDDMERDFYRSKIRKQISVTNIITCYYMDPFFSFNEPYYEQYDFWQILFFKKGSAEIVTDNTSRTVQEGQIVFRTPGKSSCMYYSKEEPSQLALISFTCNSPSMAIFQNQILTLYGEEIATLLDLIKTGARLFTPIKHDTCFRGVRLRENASLHALQYVGVSLERFLLMLYGRLINSPFFSDAQAKANRHIEESSFVRRVREYLLGHISQNLSIDEIAAHFGMNPGTMMKTFRRETGDSVINFFLELKLDAAKRMIISSSMNFAEISAYLGFSSQNYFSKFFKQRVGITPTEFSRYKSNTL